MNSRVQLKFCFRKLLAISWERKILTHMQKIHKTEMVGYIFLEGVPRSEVYLLQVFPGKRVESEGSKRLARFSLSKVLGLLRRTEIGLRCISLQYYGLERHREGRYFRMNGTFMGCVILTAIHNKDI